MVNLISHFHFGLLSCAPVLYLSHWFAVFHGSFRLCKTCFNKQPELEEGMYIDALSL